MRRDACRIFEHYEDVRGVSGLQPFAIIGELSPEIIARLWMANELITLLELLWRQASDWHQKHGLRLALEQIPAT